MPSLPDELFSLVERKVLEARSAAEAAAQAAINALAVNRAEPFRTLSSEQRRLRNALRARARQLGDGSQHRGLPFLVEEIAYQQWHRMLFARFLAENGLLMHPTGIPVTLQDCAELAPEEGEPDAWSLAARYASAMLPGIFRQDDPVVLVRFAPEGRLTLEGILDELPSLVFTADDALGWMYQFWQSQKKDEVNASERKIGGTDIAPVTQRFTEDYMVRFLLENTLGAWWAARRPNSPLVKTFTYLRFRKDGTPAAGIFPGWPERAAKITLMDPCCGSGRFLVVAFLMLWLMRMEEEGLAEAAAADAVLRDNLFGLEIDPRCTQIAAFSLALVAWKAGGYRELPLPNIACSGIPVKGQLETWTKLAARDVRLQTALERLYELFTNAPDLGSLIIPADVASRDKMFSASYAEVEPLLEKVLAAERDASDPVADVFGSAAEGVAGAARLLSRSYTLVTTNVPYLGFKKQDETLKEFCESRYPDSKMDLATVFVERCRCFTVPSGSYALVTPQNWLFQPSYEQMRRRMLSNQAWNIVARLGPRAFRTVSGEIVNVALVTFTRIIPSDDHEFVGLDANQVGTPAEKAAILRDSTMQSSSQKDQLQNPEARIVLGEPPRGTLLGEYAISPRGIVSGDAPRWIRCFWEIPSVSGGWRFLQSTVSVTMPYSGREHIIDWSSEGNGMLRPGTENEAYGRLGVALGQIRDLPATLYTGELYDNNTGVIVPHDPANVPAIWAFCSSRDFCQAVRRIDQALKVTNATLVKVPFDLGYWKDIAEAAGPLPKPHSDDPSQWLFQGYVADCTEPLQVAVAHLLGYRWPKEKPDDLDSYADEDGIVCLASIAGEKPAAERLRVVLAAVYGKDWSSAQQEGLLASVGFSGKDLEDWLRDRFFAQHCQFFLNSPFIWHIWDGRRDGFSALVNYHKLNAANLNKLIYTYLGDWIRVQRSRQDAGEAGAEGRLVAALELQKKLEAIRDGEPPYDIYVRWKLLHEQPIGWNPDLNDGVRLNIRPFVTAGVLRSRLTIHWRKDRGKNPDGSERHNDLHFTLAEKLEARRQWEGSKHGQVKKQMGQS